MLLTRQGGAGQTLDQPIKKVKKVLGGIFGLGVSKKGSSKTRKAKGKATVHTEVRIDLPGTTGGPGVFHSQLGPQGRWRWPFFGWIWKGLNWVV